MKRILTLCCAVFFLAGSFGVCLSAMAEEVTFAMLPQLANDVVYIKWRPLLDYLEKETGLKIIQIFPQDYSDHIAMCSRGEIDISYANPIAYMQASYEERTRGKGHVVLALASTSSGTEDFYGLFIAHKENQAIRKLSDIKGKKGLIVSWDAAGGGAFQRAMALDRGLDFKKHCRISEMPGHKQEKVVMAVYNRQVDFGCVRNGILELMKDEIDLSQIRVIAETPKYPAWVFSASHRVSPEMRQKMLKALVNMPSDLLKKAGLPGGVIGFVEKTDKDLEAIRKVVNKVGLEK